MTLSRNEFRKAIVSHPMWEATRIAQGLTSDTLTSNKLRELATLFGISDTMDNEPRFVPNLLEAPDMRPLEPMPNTPTPRVFLEPVPVAKSVDMAAKDKETNTLPNASTAAQLVQLISSIAGQSINEDRVNTLIREALKSHASPETIIKIDVTGLNNITTRVEGACHPCLPNLIKVLSARNPDGSPIHAWLVGPTGSGKSYAAKQASQALGLSFYVLGSMTQPHELIGFVDGHGNYHSTPFIEAFRNGGVICLDEVDRGDNAALLTLNGAMGNGYMSLPNGEQITIHPDCHIIATANTYGSGATADYIGAAKIDGAFLDRFIKITWDYDEVLERELSANPDWARRVQRARSIARSKGLKVIISPRASIHGAALLKTGLTHIEVADMLFLAGLSPEQRTMLMGVL